MKTALLVVCSLGGSAFAGERTVTLDRACVEVDASDALAPADREHSARVLRQVLETEHQLVVDSDCTETYRLSHERGSEQYVIRVHSGAGKRRMTVPALDELSEKYRKLARSLLKAKQLAATERAATERAAATAPDAPTASPMPTISRAEIATLGDGSLEPVFVPQDLEALGIDESAAARVEKRSLFYFLFGGRLTGGTGGSFGFRAHKTTVTLDFAVSWLSSGGSMEYVNGASFSAELLKYSSIASYSRVYAGGGLSVGTREMFNNDYTDPRFEGGGVHAEATAGLQIGRPRGPQLLAQLDLTLPFYKLGNWQGDTVYAPSLLMTVGVGY